MLSLCLNSVRDKVQYFGPKNCYLSMSYHCTMEKKMCRQVKKEREIAHAKHKKLCLLVETALIMLSIHSHSDHHTEWTFDEKSLLLNFLTCFFFFFAWQTHYISNQTDLLINLTDYTVYFFFQSFRSFDSVRFY